MLRKLDTTKGTHKKIRVKKERMFAEKPLPFYTHMTVCVADDGGVRVMATARNEAGSQPEPQILVGFTPFAMTLASPPRPR
jgi:hypothetical protein